MEETADQFESVDVQIGRTSDQPSHLNRLTSDVDSEVNPTKTKSGLKIGSLSVLHGHLQQLGVDQSSAFERRYDASHIFSNTRPSSSMRSHHWWVLNPETRAYQVWSCILLLLLLYTAIVQPLRIAFAPVEAVFVPDILVDVTFTLDILVSFVTAFDSEHGARLERDPRRIVRHYLKTFFFIDVISVFPFYLIQTGPHMLFSLRIPRFIKFLKLFRIMKMLRLYRLKSLLIKLEYSPYIHQKLIRIIQLAMTVLAFAHFLACAWYFIGVLGRDFRLGPGTPWIARLDISIDSQPIWYRYILSLYWALTTLTTVGYGDINAQTPPELVFAIFTMIMGSTLFAYTTATVASMIRERDHQAQRVRDKMTALRRFASKHLLSTRLRAALMKRMRRIWSAHAANDELQMAELMCELPSDLALRVTAELHRDLLERGDFVKEYDDQPAFMLSLLRLLLPLKLAQGEMLAYQGDPVRNWYLIQSGELRAVHVRYPSIVTYAVYGFGQSLGDIGLFTNGTWPASVRCATNCRLWTINGGLFLKMVEDFGLRERFANAAQQREQELRRSAAVADKNVALMEASMSESDLAMTIPVAIAAATKPPSLLKTVGSVLPKLERHDQSELAGSHIQDFAQALRQMRSQLLELERKLMKDDK